MGRDGMILDTCALLWIAGGAPEDRTSGQTLDLIDTAPVVYVSAISGFEIGTKAGSGKLILPVPPSEWFDTVLDFHHLQQLGLSIDLCLRAAERPKIHKNPCDRFIIATTLMMGMPVATSNSRFRDYGVDVLC
jgi:PIN domain nuclease of toxin-antitoxin system